jgi:hypothetical protein
VVCTSSHHPSSLRSRAGQRAQSPIATRSLGGSKAGPPRLVGSRRVPSLRAQSQPFGLFPTPRVSILACLLNIEIRVISACTYTEQIVALAYLANQRGAPGFHTAACRRGCTPEGRICVSALALDISAKCQAALLVSTNLSSASDASPLGSSRHQHIAQLWPWRCRE